MNRWVILIALASCACSAKKALKAPPGAGAGAASGPAALAAKPEPDIRGSNYIRAAELNAVAFGYDRYELGDAARAVLKANAEAIRKHPEWELLVEGHADERGTTAYNLGLGQRRAKAVRDYYLLLGLPGDRVATISFGEEKPACREAGEECWACNRRAETKVKAPATASGAKELR